MITRFLALIPIIVSLTWHKFAASLLLPLGVLKDQIRRTCGCMQMFSRFSRIQKRNKFIACQAERLASLPRVWSF